MPTFASWTPPRVGRLRPEAWALALALVGCSNYATPHHPYAPLLNREGQIDISVAAGASGATAPTIAAHAAIAPVRHLVITAGADIDPWRESNDTEHAAGELAVGAFAVGHPTLRAEILAGVGAGTGRGRWNGENGDADLEGPYVRPFLQGAIGGRYDFFTVGGGLRLGLTYADLTVSGTDPGDEVPVRSGANAQVHVDPFASFRFRYEVLELDVTGGLSLSVGNAVVGAMLNVYGALTVRLRFQAWGEPEVEPEPAPMLFEERDEVYEYQRVGGAASEETDEAEPLEPVGPAWWSPAQAQSAEPSEAEPSEAEPSEAEPSETEPSEAEPSETEPSEAEPSEALDAP